MKIEITPNVLTKDECQLLIDETNPKENGTPQPYHTIDTYDHNFKKVSCIDHPLILDLIEREAIKGVELAGVLYYPIGSYNSEHTDNSSIVNGIVTRIKNWTHTVVIFLNDQYTGGKLVYPKQGCEISPTIGTMVIASADIDHPHYVTKIENGERYTLVLRIVCPI